jgi:CYTH domain-containing protein
MKQEIERKFLVTGAGWRKAAGEGVLCCQGYLASAAGDGPTVRIRLMGQKAFLTIKGPTRGISRPEMEYEVPVPDAEYMLENLCGDRMISKVRYTLDYNGLRWEIDEFHGRNQGLILAEIELECENQPFEKPEWLGEEVSMDHRYSNSSLARHPFCRW